MNKSDILELIKQFDIETDQIKKTALVMSFIATKQQIYNKTKTVTRRLGWNNLKPGTMFWAAEQCQGIGKGNEIKRIWYIICLSNMQVKLNNITQDECIREGFPSLSPDEFVEMFCKLNKGCDKHSLVNRIEFAYPMYMGDTLIKSVVPDEAHAERYDELFEKTSFMQPSLIDDKNDLSIIYKYNSEVARVFGTNDKTCRKYIRSDK